MAMDTIGLTLTSTRPLLVHNARLSDPLDPIVKEMKIISKKGVKKTEDDIEELARLEFLGSLYFHSDLGPVIPGENIYRLLVDAARLTKDGKRIERGVQVLDAESPILYNGPRDVAGLWADKNFVSRKSVKVTTSRVIRTRPQFLNWALDVELAFDTNIIDREDILRIADSAGSYVGLGDWRPVYGRFSAEEKK